MTQNRTAGQLGTTAKSLHERQRHYDRLHHEKRLRDLEGEWGVSMPKHEALSLRNGSERALQQIIEQGMSSNSVDLSDASYLAELDIIYSRAA